MTELHEMTLNDLVDDSAFNEWQIRKTAIRKWMSAKINNCDNYENLYHLPCSKEHRCQSCKDRMKDYDITEEMLNERS